MNDADIAVSRSIHSRRRTLSAAVVERQYALHPELRDRYGERGREKCIEDTEFHLAHLSAAILASSPALFADYIDWVGFVMSAAGIWLEDVRANLACLLDVFADSSPRVWGSSLGDVESALERLARAAPESPSLLPQDGASTGIAKEYLRLLLACERHAAGCLILDAVDSGMAIRDVYLQVFQPCQRELGRLWQAGQITPAQEHYCTAATQLIMSQLAPRLFTDSEEWASGGDRLRGRRDARGRDPHGRRPAELAGWDTIYLGGNVPIRVSCGSSSSTGPTCWPSRRP